MVVSAVCYRPRRKGLNTVTGKILRLKELIAYIGLSRSVIYERMDSKSDRHDPSFPKSFALGGKAIGWNEDEVNTWLLNCKNAPPKPTPSAKARTTRIGKTSTPQKGITQKARSIRKKTPGSLAGMILDGGDINTHVLSYLQMASWTPAMGVLIVCGIAPEADCTQIPSEGTGLDDKPIKHASVQLTKARQMLAEWYEWVEDEQEPITEMPPGRFLYWCQDSGIDTDWLRLCLELLGFRDETKTDLTGSRFALLTSK
jgi:prophage regulatory protein